MRSVDCRIAISCCALIFALTCGNVKSQLVITEIMSDSSHPSSDTFGAGLANGDWWELVNLGTEPVDLSGYMWDDEDRLAGDDFSIFPEFVLPATQIVLIVEEVDVDVPDGFRNAWGLAASQLILASSQFGGGDNFSGISGGGDEVNLYNADGELVASRTADVATEGHSFSWGPDDVYLGISELGIDGAFQAKSDGSGEILLDPNYQPLFLDVASPGFVLGHEVLPGGIRGDFDGDGLVGVADIDLLCSSLAGNAAVGFDLTGDQSLSSDDLAAFLRIAATIPGDTDLNRQVNFADFLRLSTNFAASGVSWSGGDFDCNGTVAFGDFLALSANFGASLATGTNAVVPAPQGSALIFLAGLVLVQRARPLILSAQCEQARIRRQIDAAASLNTQSENASNELVILKEPWRLKDRRITLVSRDLASSC